MNNNETTNESNETSEPTNISNETLAALFHRTARLMARVHHTRGHVRHAQTHVLGLLGERQPRNQRELLEELNIRSASLSELLAKLERNGLIARERSAEDRRGFVITMTEKGKAEATARNDGRHESAYMFFSPLSSTEKQHLGNLLIKILVEFEENHREMAGPGHSHRHGCRHVHEHVHEHGHKGHGHFGHGRCALRCECGEDAPHDEHPPHEKDARRGMRHRLGGPRGRHEHDKE